MYKQRLAMTGTRPKKKRGYVWKVLTVPVMYFIKKYAVIRKKIE